MLVMRKPVRMTGCLVALSLAAALLWAPVNASQDVQLSPSLVLVLKLVSADRVQPATGVVVSDDGLVLVPSEFVTGAAEIIVLDDGTDIVSNGRPGTVKAQSPDTGLTILSVDGLRRPGIRLSRIHDLYADGTHFQAFPPARLIAAGAPPLKVPMQVGEPLPYLTGAILDGCGHLSGMTLAIDLQKPVPGQAPLIFDGDVLRDTFESLQIRVPSAACVLPPGEAEESEVQLPATQPDARAADTAQAAEVDQEPAPSPEPSANNTEPAPQALVTPDPRPASDVIPWWLQAAGLVVLLALAWGIFRNFRKHARKPAANPSAGPVQPASDEPDTVQLSGRSEAHVVAPRSGRDGEDALPDLGDLPAGCNGLVVLEGDMGGGRKSRYFRAVDTSQFELVIGRGEADIRIENSAISRRHALLACGNGAMTLSDLGSSNGLYIDGVPCLPGEVMHVQPGAGLCFGDVCLTIELLKRGEDAS